MNDTARRPLSKKFLPYLQDLNSLSSRQGQMPFLGRVKEIETVMETLLRRRKNNLLLIGKPGVGKTALIMELAARIERGEVHPFLKDKTILGLSVEAFIFSRETKGSEDFELLFQELRRHRDRLILFLDEFDLHSISPQHHSGAYSYFGTILKHHLVSRGLTVIMTTTPEEFDKHFRCDDLFCSAFETVSLEEPEIPEMRKILSGIRSHFEKSFSLMIPPALLRRVIVLAQEYNPARAFPDKAIELLDAACAKAAVRSVPRLEVQFVYEALIPISRLPVSVMKKSLRKQCLELQPALEKKSVNQQEAIVEVSRTIKSFMLTNGEQRTRPRVIFLFLGPAGIGKSFMAARLAEHFYGSKEKLRLIDLSGFKKSEDVRKLVGQNEGDEPGILIQEAEAHPFSVILFENVGEAHSGVLSFLSRTITRGEVFDRFGNSHHLGNIIFILSLTSIGEERRESSAIGFEKSGIGGKEIIIPQKIMNLLDWVDEIIQFYPLGREELTRICLEELQAVLIDLRDNYNCLLEINMDVVEAIVREAEQSGRFAHHVSERVQRLILMRALDYVTGDRSPVQYRVVLNKKKMIEFREVKRKPAKTKPKDEKKT